MSVQDFKPIVVSDAQSMSELMANFKLTLVQNVEPKLIATLHPTPILAKYQGADHFFTHLNWVNDMAMYNEITFIRNDKGQFDVTHFLLQCTNDGDTKSSKSIASFIASKPGKELKRRGYFNGTRFIDYEWFETILVYGMKDAVAMTDYLKGREWRRVGGFLYLIKFVESTGNFVYKVGRSYETKERFKLYVNEAMKREAVMYHLETVAVDNMYVAERVLINHFESHGAIRVPTLGTEYFVMYTVNVSEKAHDVRAIELFREATQ